MKANNTTQLQRALETYERKYNTPGLPESPTKEGATDECPECQSTVRAVERDGELRCPVCEHKFKKDTEQFEEIEQKTNGEPKRSESVLSRLARIF